MTMKNPIPVALSLVAFMLTALSFSAGGQANNIPSKELVNGDFQSGNDNGWDNCPNEIGRETDYGGGRGGNFVAEIDGHDDPNTTADDRILCQTITCLVPGAEYRISLLATRRTTCEWTPDTVSITITVDGSALSDTILRSGGFSLDPHSAVFTATKSTHEIRITPNFSVSCGMLVDDVSLEPLDESLSLLPADTNLCGDESLLLNAEIADGTYLWSDSSTTSSLEITEPGVYWVEVTSENCAFTDSIRVSSSDIEDLRIPEDTFLCEQGPLILDFDFPGVEIRWPDKSRNGYEISRQELVYFDLVTRCGTSTERSMVEIIDCECIIFIPDAFTPDGNGVNDAFYLRSACPLTSYDIQISDRWGQSVFSSQSIDDSWDGQINGQPAAVGAYPFKISYRTLSFERQERGVVILLR